MHQHPVPRITQAAPAGRKTAELTDQQGRSHRKVFLFEDDNAIRRLLTRLIEENGFEVLDFPSPRQLINDVEKADLLKKQDIVITDIKMPGMSGMELVNLLVRAGFNPDRIAIMSGHWMERDLRCAIDICANIFIKPFHCNDLIRWLESYR